MGGGAVSAKHNPKVPALAAQVHEMLERLREPLALDRWSIRPVSGPLAPEDGRACCEALPEYREATISIDLDRVQTGDELAEVLTHEMTHCITGPLHDLAIQQADALANLMPAATREAMRALLQEQVRKEAERVTTDVGQTYLRLLRRAGVL
jgi:hypothetical protein